MYRSRIIVACFFILSTIFTTQTVVASIDRASLQKIRSADIILFIKQNKLYADYVPSSTPGMSGLIPGVLDAKKNVKWQKEIEGYFSPVRDSLRSYSFDETFSSKLSKELRKLKWFKASRIDFLRLVDERRKEHSVLDINTENHDEIDKKFIENKNVDVVLVVEPKYKIDAFFNEYVLDATVYLYAVKESLKTSVEEDESEFVSDLLYSNNIRYSYRLYGLSTKSQAGAIWADQGGPHFIRNVVQNSIESVTRLIAYDLSLLVFGSKDKTQKKTWSGNSLIFGDMSGAIIGESKSKKIFRSKDGEIYSVVLTNQLAKARPKTSRKSSNEKPVLYIYRNEETGSLFKTDIHIDGNLVGSTGVKTYIRTEVAPGEHVVTVDAENEHKITIDAQPGMQYFISQQMRMGLFGVRAKLVPVDESIGRPAIKESKQIKLE